MARAQKGLEDQMSTARKLNSDFTRKVKAIARTDKVTVPVAETRLNPRGGTFNPRVQSSSL